MREIWKLTWRLLLIAAVAGLALGGTNALTAGATASVFCLIKYPFAPMASANLQLHAFE